MLILEEVNEIIEDSLSNQSYDLIAEIFNALYEEEDNVLIETDDFKVEVIDMILEKLEEDELGEYSPIVYEFIFDEKITINKEDNFFEEEY